MIDVVFLLIIFFLVSSHLARQERHLPVDLPESMSAFAMADDADTLVVTVDPDGNVFVAGRQVDEVQLVRAFSSFAGETDGRGAVRIRADGNTIYQHVEPILRRAAAAGLNNTSIAAVTPES